MTILQAILLGIVQGLTEFLPISSSAHLVLVPYFLGWTLPQDQVFPFDVLVQLGTLLAVIIYFWRDLWTILKAVLQGLIARKPFADRQARLGWYLILATLPAALLGALLKNQVEAAFLSPAFTGAFLIGTAILLTLAEVFSRRTRTLENLTWLDALVAGIFQALSIFPGVSRSGATMTGGMLRHLDRPAAGRFAFLMAVPIMLGAGAAAIPDLLDTPNLAEFLPVMAVGFVIAAIVGYLSIHFLLAFIARHSFYVFAVYCALLGAFTLAVNLFSYELPPQPPLPTAEIWKVHSTPALEWLTPAYQHCANQVKVGLYFTPEAAESDLVFRWGAPENAAQNAFVLGSDELAIILHPDNPLNDLTRAQLQAIFSGQATLWQGIFPPDCADCPAMPGEIHPWMYFPGEETQRLFERAVLQQPVTAPYASLAPSPAGMLEVISADPLAIGFLPRRALNAGVKAVEIPDIDGAALTAPILALTAAPPTPRQRDFLLCLQNTLNP